MKRILKIAAYLCALYVLMLTLVYFFQESLIFSPTPVFPSDLKGMPEVEELQFETKDHSHIRAICWKGDTLKPTIVFYHGNAGHVYSWLSALQFLHNNGFSVYLMDYRGYGYSEGVISSEIQFYNDANQFYALVKQREKGKVVLMGTSLGTAAASYVAAHQPVDQLILNAPFYSMKRVAAEKYPFVPQFLLRYPFENQTKLQNVKCPITVFHGTNDALFPIQHSRALFRILKGNKAFKLIEIQGAGHNDLMSNATFQEKVLNCLEN